MVAVKDESSLVQSIELATELRLKGLRVDVYPQADKLAKQFQYAEKRHIRFAVRRGDIADSLVLRDLLTRDEEPMPASRAVALLLAQRDQDEISRRIDSKFPERDLKWPAEPVGEADDSIKPGAQAPGTK